MEALRQEFHVLVAYCDNVGEVLLGLHVHHFHRQLEVGSDHAIPFFCRSFEQRSHERR